MAQHMRVGVGGQGVQGAVLESITAFTARGIENLREFLAEVRSRTGGVRQNLVDQQCELDMIDYIMVAQRRS